MSFPLSTVFPVAVANRAENEEEKGNNEDTDYRVRLMVNIGWVSYIRAILIIVVVSSSSIIDMDNDPTTIVGVTISSLNKWTIVSIVIA